MSELEQHAGENAELYAAGALDELEIARMERHAAACAQCAILIGDAEAAVLRLIEADDVPEVPQTLDRRVRATLGPRRVALGWIAAVAAAFVLGLLPWTIAVQRDRDTQAALRQQQFATVAMLNSHFLHSPFAALTVDAPAGKVVYARNGAWIYVIAGPGGDTLDVAVVSQGKRTVVGALAASSSARTAFATVTGRIDSVELLDRGSPVARAPIILSK